ncbi:MAG: lactate utilization protein [Thermodesulfobacteriota bacterium]|jgi:L-lactate utilization protein LutC
MDEFVRAHWQIVINTTMKALKDHGFEARFCATRDEAAQFILETAKDCASVGIGGTHTARALGIVPMLESAGKTVYDHWKLKVGTPEELDCRRKQMLADLFISSANALTMTGELVNREGAGNRINGMTFGPPKVIIVVGKNKIVPDLDAAIGRLESTAGPLRAMSLNRKTPCVKTGYCMDCDSPERICRITHIIHRKPVFTHITVLILDEELGY